MVNDVAGRRLDRGGAGVARQTRRLNGTDGSNRADEDLARIQRSDPVQRSVRSRIRRSPPRCRWLPWRSADPVVFLTRDRSTARPRIVLPASSRGRTRRSISAARAALRPPVRRRGQAGEYDVEPVDGLGGAGLDQVIAVLDDRPQRGDRGIHPGGGQSVRGERGDPDGHGVSIVALAAVTGGQKPHPGGQLRGDVDHVHTVLAQAARQRCTQAGCALDRPVGVRPFPGESAKRSVALVADRDRRWWLTVAARRRPRLRSTTLCADQRRSSPDF